MERSVNVYTAEFIFIWVSVNDSQNIFTDCEGIETFHVGFYHIDNFYGP